MKNVSNAQRALWTVLISSFPAPFFAGLINLALSLASPLTDFLLPPHGDVAASELAVNAFAWSALPATVMALGLMPFVLQHGTYSWLQAAIAGVLGFAAGSIIFPLAPGSALPLLAFIAGLVAVGVRAMLLAGGILREVAST